MTRLFRGDFILVARVAGLVTGVAWAALTLDTIVLLVAAAAGIALLASILLTLHAFREERARSARALGLSRALVRLTGDITAEVDLDAVFRTIVRSAVELVDAQHATMSVRVGEAFRRVAGAGTGEQVVGVEVPQGLGVIGDVVRERKPCSSMTTRCIRARSRTSWP